MWLSVVCPKVAPHDWPPAPVTTRPPWDLPGIAESYRESLRRFADLEVTEGDDALFTQIALVNEWQRFPYMDSRLPYELLPEQWLGRTAPARFGALRAQWHEAAQKRWQEIAE